LPERGRYSFNDALGLWKARLGVELGWRQDKNALGTREGASEGRRVVHISNGGFAATVLPFLSFRLVT
jgi:hypothetical protein